MEKYIENMNIENMHEKCTDELIKDYETKHVPEASDDYDNYQVKAMKEMKDFYSKNPHKIEDTSNFNEFILKKLNDGSFNSIFSIKSTADFFAPVSDYYNPFRLVSTCINTSSDSVEVPPLGSIIAGWNNIDVEQRDASAAILVRNFPIFAKMELPKHFLSRVQSNVNYLKSLCNR